ncbi:hypothetical protein GQ600_15089 [Phytophthora cactorum]|nr:hypothetical protein GQ600_15089 [Phytophthora cactorum]
MTRRRSGWAKLFAITTSQDVVDVVQHVRHACVHTRFLATLVTSPTHEAHKGVVGNKRTTGVASARPLTFTVAGAEHSFRELILVRLELGALLIRDNRNVGLLKLKAASSYLRLTPAENGSLRPDLLVRTVSGRQSRKLFLPRLR